MTVKCLLIICVCVGATEEYCNRLLLSGQKPGQPQADLMGHYVLESETNAGGGGRPVYEQKATACQRVKLSSVAENLAQDGRNEEVLMCEKKFDGKVAYLYYDAKKSLWKIGTELGSNSANLAVQSTTKFPQKIGKVWSVSDPRAKSPWVQSPNVTLTCEDHGQDPNTYHHKHKMAVNLPYDRHTDSACVGWKVSEKLTG
jgi:hypothetical protein